MLTPNQFAFMDAVQSSRANPADEQLKAAIRAAWNNMDVIDQMEIQQMVNSGQLTTAQPITAPDRLPHPRCGEQNDTAAGGG